jgi:hypothetical protein
MITSVNAFPFGLPYKQHRWPQDFHNVLTCPATRGKTLSVAKIGIILESTKKKQEKLGITRKQWNANHANSSNN